MKPQDFFTDMPAPTKVQYRYALWLLKHYREYAWQMRVAMYHASYLSGVPLTESLAEASSGLAAANRLLLDIQNGKELENKEQLTGFTNQISFLCAILSTIDQFSMLIRRYHPLGEQYYWILYYSYFSPQKALCTEDILESLAAHRITISQRSYFRKRKQAAEAIAVLLARRGGGSTAALG